VVDAEGTVLFDSDSPANSNFQYGSAAGVYGLKACADEAECSRIKVTLYSDFDGWDLGSLFVYDGPVLADIIGGFWFNGAALIGYVDLYDGSDVSFQVSGGYYSDYYSYLVEDEEGNVLVDQVEQYVPAENTFGVVVCATSFVAESGALLPLLYPNPAREGLALSGIPANGAWQLNLTDAQGRPVLSSSGIGPGTIDLTSLAGGVYLASVIMDGSTLQTTRLVVE